MTNFNRQKRTRNENQAVPKYIGRLENGEPPKTYYDVLLI